MATRMILGGGAGAAANIVFHRSNQPLLVQAY